MLRIDIIGIDMLCVYGVKFYVCKLNGLDYFCGGNLFYYLGPINVAEVILDISCILYYYHAGLYLFCPLVHSSRQDNWVRPTQIIWLDVSLLIRQVTRGRWKATGTVAYHDTCSGTGTRLHKTVRQDDADADKC